MTGDEELKKLNGLQKKTAADLRGSKAGQQREK